MSPARRWLLRLPLVVMSIAITAMSHTVPTVPMPFAWADKVYHVVLYAAYGYCALLAMRTFALGKHARIAAAALVACAFAASDELHQLFVPGRTCDALDWCADAVGSLVGIVVGHVVHRSPYARDDL